MNLPISKNERDLLLNLCKVSVTMYGSETAQNSSDKLDYEIKARKYAHLVTKLQNAS